MSGSFMRNYVAIRLVRSHLISDSAATAASSLVFRLQKATTKHYCRFPHFFKRTAARDAHELSSPSLLFSSSSFKSGCKAGFVGWYLDMLNSQPILTKSITASLIYVAADLSSQTLARSMAAFGYDLVRTARMGAYGLLVVGSSLHFWFNLMSKLFPKRDLPTTILKIAMGQLLYGPFMTVVFFSLNAHLQGEKADEIFARLKRDLVPTLRTGIMYWPICDFITFKYIPVHLQPLVSNSFAFVWTVYMTYMASLAKVEAIA